GQVRSAGSQELVFEAMYRPHPCPRVGMLETLRLGVDALHRRGPVPQRIVLRVGGAQVVDLPQQVCPAALLEPGVVVIGGVKSLTSHFYLAVLVARLVGMHTADTRRPR